MLRNGGDADPVETSARVVYPHHKGAGPEVWPPMAHRFDQPNELPLFFSNTQKSCASLYEEEKVGGKNPNTTQLHLGLTR
jgi:hypothetical protein